MKTVYLLIHYVKRNGSYTFAGIIGVYSTDDKAREAIPSRYDEKHHKYEVHPMILDQISPHTYHYL